MTVSARSATKLPQTAIDRPGEADGAGFVDMRGASPVRAGTYPYDGLDETSDLVTGWHTHDLHQIEYAFEGVVEVETETAHYLLPPQQAVWIPAGLRHRTTLKRVRTVSVFFEPDMVPDTGDRARVLAALPVMREMIVYGARWPISRATSDPVADAYFDALALLTTEWLEHETPLCLPASTEPVVGAVMAYTQDHLRDVTEREVCRAVGVSERTLRRQFAAATGISWRRYLLVSRLLHRDGAAGRTVHDGPPRPRPTSGSTASSAFTRAFRRYTGETPTAYRRRIATDRIATDRITTGT